MKNIFLMLAIFLLSTTFANEDLVKATHNEKLFYYGHRELIQGQHQFFYPTAQLQNGTPNNIKSLSSIYSKDNMFSSYMEEGNRKLYCFAKITPQPQGVTITVTHKINQNQSTYTLKYDIKITQGKKLGHTIEIDRDATDLQKPGVGKILGCIALYASDLGSAIAQCAQKQPDIAKCVLDLLKFIADIYNCIFYSKDVQASSFIYWRVKLSPVTNGFVKIKSVFGQGKCDSASGCREIGVLNGTSIKCTAIPAPNMEFDRWLYAGNLTSFAKEFVLTPSAGGDLEAKFRPKN